MKILVIKHTLELEVINLEVLPMQIICKDIIGYDDESIYKYYRGILYLNTLSLKENDTEYILNAYTPDDCDIIEITNQLKDNILAKCKNSELTYDTKMTKDLWNNN